MRTSLLCNKFNCLTLSITANLAQSDLASKQKRTRKFKQSKDGSQGFHRLTTPATLWKLQIYSHQNTNTNNLKQAANKKLEIMDLAKPPPEEILTQAAASITNDISAILNEVPLQMTVGKSACLMNPSGPTLQHAAGSLLQNYAQNGCPVDLVPNWCHEQIITALEHGPH